MTTGYSFVNIGKSIDTLIEQHGSVIVSDMLTNLCELTESNTKVSKMNIVLVFAKSHFSISGEKVKRSQSGKYPTARKICIHILIRELNLSVRDICNEWGVQKASVHRFLKDMDGILETPIADQSTYDSYKVIREKVVSYVNAHDGIIKDE